MPVMEELLEEYEQAETVVEAERALDALAAQQPSHGLELGELYDDLATSAVEESRDFGVAARIQRKALDHDCRHRKLGREMLGWYLLRDGRAEDGEAEFAALLHDYGDADVDVLVTLANARFDAEDRDGALEAFDRALDAARATGEDAVLDQVRRERLECRDELGLPLDEDDLAAPDRLVAAARQRVIWSLVIFPRDARDEARARWPDLDGDLADADAYYRGIEGRLREMSASTGQRPLIAPIDIGALVAFAEGVGLDPGSPEARSRYGAERARLGLARDWPPGRNDPCWCGSSSKYKRCCAG